ncbi:MAG: protein YgfX [Methylophagaceae bacterium]
MPPIIFSLKISRSNRLLIYLVLIHMLMLVTLISLLALSWWSLVVTILLGVSFIYCCQQQQWLKSTKSIIKIERTINQQWSLLFLDNSQSSDLMLIKSLVTPQLVILYFKGSTWWNTRSVTIIADAVDAELFRQLRVYCRDPKTFQQ